jgi:magnesium and cobalt transporter
MVRGLAPLEEFNAYFDADLTHDKFDTIGGLVTFELGHLPERGEEINIGKFHFKIISANSRRIVNMQVSLPADSESVSNQTANEFANTGSE